MVTSFVTSADGTRIAYDVTGHGPVLMLLHGAGKTRRDWYKAGYVDRLRDDFTVVTVDLRGSGESDFLTEMVDYAVERLCDDLNAVADACAIQRFLIWGYSFGGNIARYLGAWSDRVAATAVIGIPFGPAVDHDFDRFITEFVAKWQPLADAYKAGSVTERQKASAVKGRIPAWVACFQAMRSWPSIMPADMRCPTLLVVGTRNQTALTWVKAHQTALDQTNVQVAIIDGLDHPHEFSDIERVFPIVSAFFRRRRQAFSQ